MDQNRLKITDIK